MTSYRNSKLVIRYSRLRTGLGEGRLLEMWLCGSSQPFERFSIPRSRVRPVPETKSRRPLHLCTAKYPISRFEAINMVFICLFEMKFAHKVLRALHTIYAPGLP